MKREFLTKELGLSKEATEKIMAQYGESVNSLKKENERLMNENEGLKTTLSGADNIKAHADELEIKNAELEKNVNELNSQLENFKLSGALSEKLMSAGAKNLKAVSALIDKTKVSFEGGMVLGLDEQLKTIKEECDYLFYGDSQASGMRHTSSGRQTDGFTSYARAAAKID